ncbi:hypothetical protein [Nocardia lasii]|uniref:Uncharacterized protein n=1 Tax=Nocardia lasii TaxID=1616107 RepID=A0ABW1JMP9_9NOCA
MSKAVAISKHDLNTALVRAGYEPVGDAVYRSGVAKVNAGVKSKVELAMFLTQVLWESGGLKRRIGADDEPQAFGEGSEAKFAVIEPGLGGPRAPWHGIYLELVSVVGVDAPKLGWQQ